MPRLLSKKEFLDTASSADISTYKKTGKLPSYVKTNPSSTRRKIVRQNVIRGSSINPSSIRRKTLKAGKPYRSTPLSGKGKQKKEDKKPLGTKGGKGKPARTYKKGVPHGVDKKDQKGNTIIEVKKGGSVQRGIGPAGASTVSKDGRRMQSRYGKTMPGGLKGTGKNYTARERAITRAGVGGTGIQRAILALRRLKKGKPQPHGPSTKKSPITKKRRAKRPGVRGTGRGAKARRS
jgi:hypothetical protein